MKIEDNGSVWRKAVLENIDTHFAAQQRPLTERLVELVRIPSVCVEGAGGYPIGTGVDQVLLKALQLAGEFGLRTQYGDGGYYGFAEVGEGAEILGIRRDCKK
jgi:succinyl-diaminopimelate desuccinylase